MKFNLEPWVPAISRLTSRARQQAVRLRQSLDRLQHQHLDPWLNPPTPKAILFASDDVWRLAVLLDDQTPRYADVPPLSPSSGNEADTPEHLSGRISQTLRAILAEAAPDLADAPVDAVLALPASWCYSAQVSTEGLPRGSRHAQPLLYRLEEKLPLPAEDVTADFQVHGPIARGVAVASARLSPLLNAVEQHDVHVHAIAPTTLLALQSAIAPQAHASSPDTPPRLVLLGDGEGLDLVLLAGSSASNASLNCPWIEAWHRLPRDADLVSRWINLQCLRQPARVIRVEAVGLSSAFHTSLRERQPDLIDAANDDKTSTHDLAARATADILAERDTPWFNLRQGALGAADRWRTIRPALHAAMLAAVFCLLLLSLTMTSRGLSYRWRAQSAEQAQSRIFYDLYPGRALPLAVRAFLDSEQRRLQGLAGQGNDTPRPASALATLHQTLRRLPTGLRFRLLELRFSPTAVTLDGQVRSHADADVFAAALRAQNGLAVDPPRTERLRDQAIAFTLHAKYTPAATSLPPITPPLTAKAPLPPQGHAVQEGQ
ncbi:MAG: hypothetical protein IT442_14265 [Phycisphaeraceae bacterium]|nr:hypothetical protein [Phycisphaeraceae bacterium]